ncbi:hypothetical protein CCACVL1_24093 [Corchorus capsularis]|uniref:non-specific serine/threonine protein kinase n=1 Tax=Corchorus capsularis TaxID=210143 RepID=A0A1R3GR42_COCAP|nr:hypothetical protein CCACVL1_24093 [Corchorus capsularis]
MSRVDESDSPTIKPARTSTDESPKPQSKTDSLNLNIYSPDDLRVFTENFSTNNLIGKTQFGQVYRGKIEETGKEPRSVTIKTWNDRVERFRVHDDRKDLLEDFNPLIFDFGLMSGGIIGKKSLAKKTTPMTPGYCDMFGCLSGYWTRWSDVYSYGGILIELIAKRITDMEDYGKVDDRDPPAVRRAETDEDFIAFTDNFSTSNLIGKTQFGQVYRGKIEETGKEPRSVTINTWNDQEECYMYHDDRKVLLEVDERDSPTIKPARADEELRTFTDNFSENNLIGKTQFGQVYRGKIEETGKETQSVTIKTWNDRAEDYIVHDDRKVLLEDFNPLIFDFGLMSGGIIGKKSLAKKTTPMTPGYCDMFGCLSGSWTRWSDVYSYGGILIELIAKKITNMEDHGRVEIKTTSRWALDELKSGILHIELVDASLQKDQDYNVSDALLVAELGMSCVELYPEKRPRMRQIVKRLKELSIVKEH